MNTKQLLTAAPCTLHITLPTPILPLPSLHLTSRPRPPQVLRHGAHVDDRDGLTDMTLLHYASKAGARGVGDGPRAQGVVAALLARGADPYTRCRWTNMAAVHYAAYFDVAPVLQLLLEASKGQGQRQHSERICGNVYRVQTYYL